MLVDQPGIGNQFTKHHCSRLQRLNLDVFIAPLINMLHRQNAYCPLVIDDRHTGEGMEFLFTCFRPIFEVWMRLCLGEVQCFDMLGNCAGQALTDRHSGDVNRALVESAGREQFQQAIAQKVD